MRHIAAMVLAGLLVLPGCQRPEELEPRQPEGADAITVSRAAPDAAARSFFDLARVEIAAAAVNDRRGVRWAREQLHEVISEASLRERLAQFRPDDPEAVEKLVGDLVGNWTSALAYYADALELDRMSTRLESARAATVTVPAVRDERETVIELRVLRGDDDAWRVADFKFAGAGDDDEPRLVPAAPPAEMSAGDSSGG